MTTRVAIVVSGILALLFSGCLARERVVVPQGYRGFVGIFFERGHIPLPKEGGAVIIEFPADGIIFTSSALDTHWKKLEFFERDGARLNLLRSNLVGPIPSDVLPQERIVTGGFTITDGRGPPAQIYFVGDAGDRAKLDWQSSNRWWQNVLQSKK
jgi:hypothetical protein